MHFSIVSRPPRRDVLPCSTQFLSRADCDVGDPADTPRSTGPSQCGRQVSVNVTATLVAPSASTQNRVPKLTPWASQLQHKLSASVMLPA